MAAEGGDAFSQNKEGVVDVPGLLQPLSKSLGFVASFRSSQVTERESEERMHLHSIHHLSTRHLTRLPSTKRNQETLHKTGPRVSCRGIHINMIPQNFSHY